MTKSKRSDEIRRFKVWKTCVATVQNPQLSVLYNSTTENIKTNLVLGFSNLSSLLFNINANINFVADLYNVYFW